MSRRQLLIGLGLALLTFVLFRWRFLLAQIWGRPGGLARAPRESGDPYSDRGQVRVVLVSGGSPAERLEAALAEIGGLEPLQVGGKTVLVKPNVVRGSPPPTTTDPELVRAVVRKLREAGAAKIWVGDMSALASLGTRYSIQACGIREAAESEGAEVVCFDEHDWIPMKLPAGCALSEVHVSEFIVRADLLINLPVLKTHQWAGFSCCLKNFVGATHGRYRPYRVDSKRWEEIVAEINAAYRPALNLVDASRIMYSGGPWRGDADPAGLLLASSDRVAADALAVALLKTYGRSPKLDGVGVWEERQIRRAVELRLGATNADLIDLRLRHLAPASPELHNRIEKARALLEASL